MGTERGAQATPLEQVQNLESVLGFRPYALDMAAAVAMHECIAPNDYRQHLLGQLALNNTLDPADIIHAQALRNLESFVSEEIEQSPLFDYQRVDMRSIKDFLQFPIFDETGKPIRRGYCDSATGTGKTVEYTIAVREMMKEIDGTPPLKTLVLVPGVDLVDQTIGKSYNSAEDEEVDKMLKGFAQFAPDIHATEYHRRRKDLSGEVVVMTYKSLVVSMQKNRFDPDIFGLIILDEAHRGLGPLTKETLETVIKDKIAIGFSASTEYADNKKVADLLPIEIYKRKLRDSIEQGHLPPLRVLAIPTPDTIKSSSTGDFSEKDFEKLIVSKWRNQTAVTIAKDFVEAGQKGIITCMPGQNHRHAHMIADALSDQMITDSRTGKRRHIVAEALHGDMTKKERREFYKLLYGGKIDVVTGVNLINEGLDWVDAKFMINLRPTASRVIGTQRVGRILRPNGELATFVDFIDNVEKPGARLFTIYHALEETTVTQNKIYSNVRVYNQNLKRGLDWFAPLPVAIENIIAKLDYSILDDRVFSAPVEKATENHYSANDLKNELHINQQTLTSLLDHLGIGGKFMRRQNSYALYYTADDKAQIDAYLTQEYGIQAPAGAMQLYPIYSLLHTHSDTLLAFLEEINVQGQPMRHGTNMGTFYTEEQVEMIVSAFTEEFGPLAGPDEVSKLEIAKNLNCSRITVADIIAKAGITGREARRGPNRKTQFYPKEVEQFVESSLPPLANESDKSIAEVALDCAADRKTILAITKDLGIKPIRKRRKNTHTDFLTPGQVIAVKKRLRDKRKGK